MKIEIIILAAGMSARMGENKLSLPIAGKTLIEYPISAALQSEIGPVTLVSGKRTKELIKQQLMSYDIKIIQNNRAENGQSSSIVAALKNRDLDVDGVMFMLGDQPLVTSKLIKNLADAFYSSLKENNKPIVAPFYGARRGNPVLFHSDYIPQLIKIQGDVGAREIIKQHKQNIVVYEIDNEDIFFDVDTPQDYQYLKKMI